MSHEASREEALQAARTYLRQEIESLYISFPAIVVEHLGLVRRPDGPPERGVLIGRAEVQPKPRVLFHKNIEIPLPRLINIPAPPTMRGPFMSFGAFDNGQTVLVTVSQVALDHMIEGTNGNPEYIETDSPFDPITKHPIFPRFLDPKDAWISSDAVRMNVDPLFPKEYLNDFGFMLLAPGDPEYKPISKFIMRRNGQILMEGRHLYLRFSEGIDVGEIGGANVVHLEPGHPPITMMWAVNSTSFVPGEKTGPEVTDPDSPARA